MAIQPTDSLAAAPYAKDGRRSGGERARLVAEVLAAYVRAHREMRRAPIAEVVARIRCSPPSRRSVEDDPLEEARRLGWIVARLLAHLPGDTRCLVRSLVLLRLLAARDIPSRLVIGARSEPEFLAHAWVEFDGDAVLDPGDSTFGRLVEL